MRSPLPILAALRLQRWTAVAWLLLPKSGIWTSTQKDPSQCFCWDRSENHNLRCHPAWCVSAPSSLRTFIRGPLFTEGRLRLTYSGFPFLLALGRPFLSASLPPFHLRRLSERKDYGKYFSSSTVYQSIAYAFPFPQVSGLFFRCSVTLGTVPNVTLLRGAASGDIGDGSV